ncbi:type II/IV secretion system protein, partial [Candidatus Sumerlaeota bacterium]|nr:type II/IV secretion system protein [Candidatus Sumerlaeota bacterium]
MAKVEYKLDVDPAAYPDLRDQMKDLVKAESVMPAMPRQRPVVEGEQADRLHRVSAPSDVLSPDEKLDMIKILSEQQGLPFINLADYSDLGKPEYLQLIPAEFALNNKCLPIEMKPDGSLVVAISDPLNVHIPDDLRLLTGRNIIPVVANEKDLAEYVERFYGMGEETIEKMVEELERHGDNIKIERASEFDLSNLEEVANQPPVIRLVNLLMLQAIKDRASDLHIEPFTNQVRIRYRVDGALREIPSPPKSMHVPIISRVKVMANLDISETRRPQDGRIKLMLEGREVDLRVSVIPTVHGEATVMRILDKNMMALGIHQLGMSQGTLDKFLKVLRKPNGILLVTGPTGCGKTTTLYAALAEINDPGDKIITTEDPVEYELPGVIQVNVNPAVELTFARCLRHIVRQDPDKILVGEVRDLETAEIAIQASLTGHLVFSTLHTNNAASSVTRLIDMGIEPFLITSTLEGIVGQRLVRTVCPLCKIPYSPTNEELADFGIGRDEVSDLTFQIGKGCDECGHTGYKGRMGIFEFLVVSEPIRDLILERASADEINHKAIEEGMQTMRQDGWLKICMGLTTFEEVARQTPWEEKGRRAYVAAMAEKQPVKPKPEREIEPRP